MSAFAGKWRRTVVAGGATCALLGLGAAGYLALRGQGVLRADTLVSRGLLPDTGLVVVAGFDDHAGDPGLVSALEQAFRVHLSQSPAVALASEALVDDVLERMQVEPGAGLGLDVAREAAIREGWRAVVAGELLVPTTRLLVWDVSDLEDPILVHEHYGPSAAIDHNLYVRGNRLYQSNYTFGVRVLDVTDPISPLELGYLDTHPADDQQTFSGSWSNYPLFGESWFVVTSIGEGLFILRAAG